MKVTFVAGGEMLPKPYTAPELAAATAGSSGRVSAGSLKQCIKERRPTAARGWAPEARFFRARAGREAGASEPHLRLDGGHYRCKSTWSACAREISRFQTDFNRGLIKNLKRRKQTPGPQPRIMILLSFSAFAAAITK